MAEVGHRRSGASQQQVIRLLKLWWMALIVLSGCLGVPGRGTPQTGATPTATDGGSPVPPTKSADMESVLAQLVRADNRTAFAETHGLRYRDGQVLVVIELAEGRTLPDEFDIDVESTHEGLVQAYVDVDDLVAVAGHRNVTYVRTPREPIQHDNTTQ